jgi:serine phosphatase RsbU (regulator of sigma subunit)
LPVILVSGLDHPDDIVRGLGLGAYDYITKPVNMPVLAAKVATRTALKQTRDDLKRTILRQATELRRNERELSVAAEVQRSTLPQEPPQSAGLATAWCYEPATQVGGDLFDVIALPGGRTLLFVADAMGHGVQAALVASTVKATLAAHLHEADDLSILMGLLDLAHGDLFKDRFVTAAACVVDPGARTLRYAVAGHPPVLVSGPGGVVSLGANNPPLGLSIGPVFEESEEIALDPGSCLLLYTDGLTEAWGPHGAQFGGEALASWFARLSSSGPDAIVGGIRGALEQFRGPVPLTDDLTILAARLL